MMKIATLLVFAAAFATAATAQADTTANLGSFAYYGAHHKFGESRAARPAAAASTAPAGPANHSTVLVETNMSGSAGNTTPAALTGNTTPPAAPSASSTPPAAPSASSTPPAAPSASSTPPAAPAGSDFAAAPAGNTPPATPAGSADFAAPPAGADSESFIAPSLPAAGEQPTAASDALIVPDTDALLAPIDNGSAAGDLGEAAPNGAAAIPEPATPALIGLALAGLALRRKALAKRKA